MGWEWRGQVLPKGCDMTLAHWCTYTFKAAGSSLRMAIPTSEEHTAPVNQPQHTSDSSSHL